MTAESGETWWAWRSTSMPLRFGIRMSVTITSKSAESSFRVAASPELTVSTLYPSRRRVISSISQIERSSSQIRILGMRALSDQPLGHSFCDRLSIFCGSRDGPFFCRPANSQDERTALLGFRSHPDLTLMCLHNLIHNGQPQAGPALELRLERLKDFLHHLWAHPRTGISKTKLPVAANFFNAHRQSSALFHRADGVFAEIPEDLLHPVAIDKRIDLFGRVAPLDLDSGVLRLQPVSQQGQRVFEQRNHVHVGKAILLGARIGQKVGDDVVQALRLAGHNLQQAAMLVAEVRHLR